MTAIGRTLLVAITSLSSSLALAALPNATHAATVSGSQTFQTLLPGQTNALCFTLTISTSLPVTLQGVRFTNRSLGPGNQSKLDAELGQPRIYLDDGDKTFNPAADDSLTQTAASGGVLRFSPLNVAIPALGSVTLFVVTDIPLQNVRDSDNLDLSIQGPSDLTFSQPTTTDNAWPVEPAGSIVLDGASAAQMPVVAVGPARLLAGSIDNLAFDVLLPPNGYKADRLEKLAIINEGTAKAGSDIAAVGAWADNGDSQFDPTSDQLLGKLLFTGDRWQLTGISQNVPSGGLRVFFSVDLGDFATDANTIRLALPTPPDVGVGMASANDGPLDRIVDNPYPLNISTADRITLAAAPVPSQSASPGRRDVPLAHIVVENSYANSRTLSEFAFTNEASGPGSIPELDSELGQLALRFDGNGDGVLGSLAEDPLLGTARFMDGEAHFGGLAWPLAPGKKGELFLTGDLSLSDARDGDVLSVSVRGASQVRFDDSTRIFANWPLDSGARITVDGMVAAQIAVFETPATTLGRGEGPALVMDLLLPRNGYDDDVLDGLRLVNLGTGGPGDIAELRLWGDGGDGQFTPGSGDDRDLGPLTWQADHWQSAVLAEALAGAGARLFVSLTVSASPADSATVRLAIPIGGVTVGSGNDGPLDGPVAAPNGVLLSNAPLLASIEILPHASTIGQTVNAIMIVRNAGSESVNGIAPSALSPAGSGSLTPVSGPSPPSFDLAPGAQDSFLWVYTAAGAGDVRLTGSAGGTGSPSGAPRNSLPTSSNTHQVFTRTQSLDFTATSSLPASVNGGQTDVAAMTLIFNNPGGPESSPVRLLGLRVQVENGTGAGIVPSSIVSQVVVSNGAEVVLRKSSIESSGTEIDLTFASPVSIPAGESAALTIALDIASSTTVPAFRLAITDSTVFSARDALSGAPVSVALQGGTYPVLTAVARVGSQATEIDVAADTVVVHRVGRGQAGVELLRVRLESPGVAGITSDVRVFGFSVVVEDTNGAAVPRPADFLSFLRVETPFQLLAARVLSPSDGPALALTLSLPLNVPANALVDLFIRGDVSSGSPLGAVRLRLLDPPTFDARDANTRDPVPAVYAGGQVTGNTVVVEARADTLRVEGTPLFPQRSTVGTADVRAMSVTLRHPGSAGTARIAIDDLTIQCRDESRRPLVPSTYLSRVAVIWNGVPMAEVTNPPSSGGSVTIPLPRPLLEPYDSAAVELVADFSAAAPVGSIEFMIFSDGIHAEDANLGTAVAEAPSAGSELPLVSGLCRVESPPRELLVDLVSQMPAAVAPDGRTVVAGHLTLNNTAPQGSDSILVDHLVFRASDQQEAAVPVGSAATRVEIYRQGTLWAQSGALLPDSTLSVIPAPAPLRVPPGSPVTLEVRWITAVTGYPSSFRLGCDASGIGVVQPSSALLQIRIAPAQTVAFPIWTGAGVFATATLHDSYSNFPNPFAAGRGATAFAYYLRDPGRVTLKIYTPAGDGVATLLLDAARLAGMNQSDLWDGRNGNGSVVRNGVYIAELTVTFADGSRERVRRKVAVVR